jgi:hypothetical protein
MSDLDRGVVMFAYNNDKISYDRLATVCALTVKSNLKNNNVTLLTDGDTYRALEETCPKEVREYAFDHIVVEDLRHEKNTRLHHDSFGTEFVSQFSNANKHNVFNLSPYKQSLLIDVDYLLGSNKLDLLFETDYELALFRNAHGLRGNDPHSNEQRLHPLGIDMWWSTVIYWQKTDYSKKFFDMWHHVKENYDYYRFLYKFPGNMFRTDYASSIAIHILNGQVDNNLTYNIPPGSMRYMDQLDNLVELNGKNNMLFMANMITEPSKNILVRIKDEDVHMMNKMAILRHYNDFLNKYYYD